MFFPPVSFGLVEEGLYRSALPNEINYPFLERLGLKTIIYLYPDDDINAQLVSFLEDQDVTLVSLGEHDDKRNKSWAPVGEETVLAALERIVDSAHYPILITCNTGKHRTGTVVACLRKLQRWNLTSIFEEYRRFTKHKVRVQNEQFIELFDTDLVHLPPEAPPFVNRFGALTRGIYSFIVMAGWIDGEEEGGQPRARCCWWQFSRYVRVGTFLCV